MSKSLSDAERRDRNIRYQENRQKKLKALGEFTVTVRLDKKTYKRLANLCENLGYSRPEAKKHNLIETYSIAIKHLIDREYNLRSYIPKSTAAKELYRLHKVVSHLIYDKQYPVDAIIKKMKKENHRSPGALLKGEQTCNWVEKSISNLLNEKMVINKIRELDEI